jgi:hypothetical protein
MMVTDASLMKRLSAEIVDGIVMMIGMMTGKKTSKMKIVTVILTIVGTEIVTKTAMTVTIVRMITDADVDGLAKLRMTKMRKSLADVRTQGIAMIARHTKIVGIAEIRESVKTADVIVIVILDVDVAAHERLTMRMITTMIDVMTVRLASTVRTEKIVKLQDTELVIKMKIMTAETGAMMIKTNKTVAVDAE